MQLKQRLETTYEELRSDFGDEEIDNVLNVLEEYDDELTDLDAQDATLLQRLLEDEELIQEVENATSSKAMMGNPFDDDDIFNDELYE